MIRSILAGVLFLLACAAFGYLAGRALDIEARGDAHRIEKFKHMRISE